jgi:S1-C subfamily serine protease
VGAIVAGGVLAAGFEGVGARVRARLRSPAFAAADGALGALLTACIGLLIAWVLGAVALQASPDIRRDVQRSTILRQLNAVLPPTGPLLNTLRGLDPFPRIDGPEARVPAPRAAIARDPQVAAARDSVVKILGTACGVGVEGSGWVASPGVVVTNAHVVAGQDDTRVLARGEEPGLEAQAIAFDSRNDLAILRVGGLDAPALELAPDPKSGTSAAILGFPLNGPYDVRAGRLGATREVVSQDAYGRGPVRREIVALRGAVRSGNSGGPMVDGGGRVVTTIFAATTSGPRGGYGVPNAIVRDTLADARDPVDTGPCGG